MKQFDWTTSVAHKCGPKKLDQRGEMKNDNNEFQLDVREYIGAADSNRKSVP